MNISDSDAKKIAQSLQVIKFCLAVLLIFVFIFAIKADNEVAMINFLATIFLLAWYIIRRFRKRSTPKQTAMEQEASLHVDVSQTNEELRLEIKNITKDTPDTPSVVVEQPENNDSTSGDAYKDNQYVDTATAAKFLQLKQNTLETWRSKKTGPRFRKLGSRVEYKIKDLKAYMEACMVHPKDVVHRQKE